MKRRKFRSLSFRNFMTMAVILLLSFALLGASFAAFSYRLTMNERRDAMKATADEASHFITAYHQEMELDDLELRMTLSILANTSNCHILLCATDGTVVSCSDRQFDCGHIGKMLPRDLVNGLWRGLEYSFVSDLDGLYTAERYVIAEPIREPGGNTLTCFLILSGDPASMTEIWRQFASVFLAAAICVIMVAFVVSVITSERMTQPINEIAGAVDRFARGDYSARVGDPGRSDEIGELADGFNVMADAIENQEKLRRDFIANVSHELKTPMTTITGFAEGILDGTIPPEQHARYLAAISSETKRLSRLVRNMLEASRLQSLDRAAVLQKSFDLTEVVGMALLSLEKKITDRGLDVQAQLPENRILVRGDKDAITQVVYNLIDNAAKFAETGTALDIQLWKCENKAYVSVADRGTSIPPEELPLIFARFHKSDKSRSLNPDGVGLGLYIVKTILDNHGEDIFVTSENGITKFTFTMTLAP